MSSTALTYDESSRPTFEVDESTIIYHTDAQLYEDGYQNLPMMLKKDYRVIGMTKREYELMEKILSYQRGPGIPWVSMERLSEEHNIHYITIYRNRRDMVKHGFLRLVKGQIGNKRITGYDFTPAYLRLLDLKNPDIRSRAEAKRRKEIDRISEINSTNAYKRWDKANNRTITVKPNDPILNYTEIWPLPACSVINDCLNESNPTSEQKNLADSHDPRSKEQKNLAISHSTISHYANPHSTIPQCESANRSNISFNDKRDTSRFSKASIPEKDFLNTRSDISEDATSIDTEQPPSGDVLSDSHQESRPTTPIPAFSSYSHNSNDYTQHATSHDSVSYNVVTSSNNITPIENRKNRSETTGELYHEKGATGNTGSNVADSKRETHKDTRLYEVKREDVIGSMGNPMAGEADRIAQQIRGQGGQQSQGPRETTAERIAREKAERDRQWATILYDHLNDDIIIAINTISPGFHDEAYDSSATRICKLWLVARLYGKTSDEFLETLYRCRDITYKHDIKKRTKDGKHIARMPYFLTCLQTEVAKLWKQYLKDNHLQPCDLEDEIKRVWDDATTGNIR